VVILVAETEEIWGQLTTVVSWWCFFARFGRTLFFITSLLSVMYVGLWGLLRISAVCSSWN